MGGIFYKNSFILGKKLNVLKEFMLRVERKVQLSWEHPFFFVARIIRALERGAQFSEEVEFTKAGQPRIRLKKSSLQKRTGYLCLLQYYQLRSSTGSTQGFFFVPENKHFYFHGTHHVERTLYVAVLRIFFWNGFLSAFMVIVGDFWEARFIWGTSLNFSTVIWSYVTSWKTNEIEAVGTRTLLGKLLWYVTMGKNKIMHSIKHWFAINVLSTMTMSKIFSLMVIEERNDKKKAIFRNRLKKLR